MSVTLAEPPVMAKSDRTPKRSADMTAIRVEKDINDWLRRAAAIHGESIVEYANRVLLERAKADVREDARKQLQAEEEEKKGKGRGEA